MNEFFWEIFWGVTSISFHIASVYFAFNNDGRFAMTLLAVTGPKICPWRSHSYGNPPAQKERVMRLKVMTQVPRFRAGGYKNNCAALSINYSYSSDEMYWRIWWAAMLPSPTALAIW